jgi:hypothetical protein
MHRGSEAKCVALMAGLGLYSLCKQGTEEVAAGAPALAKRLGGEQKLPYKPSYSFLGLALVALLYVPRTTSHEISCYNARWITT